MGLPDLLLMPRYSLLKLFHFSLQMAGQHSGSKTLESFGIHIRLVVQLCQSGLMQLNLVFHFRRLSLIALKRVKMGTETRMFL